MQDGYGRVIDYLRISVTDRCNFRCSYCMPSEGVKLLEASEILSYEEFLRVIKILGRHGVDKVRLTGGEPLVRKGIVDLIRAISALGTVKDLSITTNGSLLKDCAYELKAAGLGRVNISIDTLDPERFAGITGRGKIADTLCGIESALAAGFNPVKLNVVLTEMLTKDDISRLVEQVYRYPLEVRFIEYMPVGRCGVNPGFSINTVKKLIDSEGLGLLQPSRSARGNGPARYYRLPLALGVFGFITPISDHFCSGCNRIRLTADGKFKPCLLENIEIDIKAALRSGCSDNDVSELFFKALLAKPVHHDLSSNQRREDFTRGMSQVGG